MLLGSDPIQHQPAGDQSYGRKREPQATRRGAIGTRPVSWNTERLATVLAPNTRPPRFRQGTRAIGVQSVID